jgi:hypothetical protein
MVVGRKCFNHHGHKRFTKVMFPGRDRGRNFMSFNFVQLVECAAAADCVRFSFCSPSISGCAR